LLDTHALLWALDDNRRLSARARSAIGDEANEKIVSAASAFEITTKHRLGKLPEAAVLMPDFEAAIAPFGFTLLSITTAHAALAGSLDISHKDPFDRLLIAQALVEGVALVSNEAVFDRFGVERIW
jgi:PIN domain nuclease of toxin-antitoxin system